MTTQHTQVMEVHPDSNVKLTDEFEHFKKQKGIKKILGFSGGADDGDALIKFLEDEIRKISDSEEVLKKISGAKDAYVTLLVDTILRKCQGYHIGILTGGTKWGVPRIAAESAKKYGFTTIGVFPEKAQKKGVVLSDETLDLKVCVHPSIGNSKWGDEAAVYTTLLDAVIIIGGKAGTMVEVAHLLKMNEGRRRPKPDDTDMEGPPPKEIIPFYGTGGTADKTPFFPGNPVTMAECLPSELLTSTDAIYDYLKKVEFLSDDIYDIR